MDNRPTKSHVTLGGVDELGLDSEEKWLVVGVGGVASL
jgi:hypothetical protein